MKRTPLISKRVDHSSEAGYREWKAPAYGRCQRCGKRGLLIRHHVVLEQHVRAIDPERAYDLANAMLLGAFACRCHSRQHNGARRLPLSSLPADAIAFAVDLLGEARAAAYLRRYYAAG